MKPQWSNNILSISASFLAIFATAGVGALDASPVQAQAIVHEAEHFVLLHQYKEQWETEDQELDQRLVEIRERNGGKPPNIVYILVDDMGFGEFGMPALNKIRGGRTPNLDAFAEEGMAFTRFYAENICTSTRVAMMTGRYAVRTGMQLTKVTPPEGVGLRDEEVTIAELLSDAGYATHHGSSLSSPPDVAKSREDGGQSALNARLNHARPPGHVPSSV